MKSDARLARESATAASARERPQTRRVHDWVEQVHVPDAQQHDGATPRPVPREAGDVRDGFVSQVADRAMHTHDRVQRPDCYLVGLLPATPPCSAGHPPLTNRAQAAPRINSDDPRHGAKTLAWPVSGHPMAFRHGLFVFRVPSMEVAHGRDVHGAPGRHDGAAAMPPAFVLSHPCDRRWSTPPSTLPSRVSAAALGPVAVAPPLDDACGLGSPSIRSSLLPGIPLPCCPASHVPQYESSDLGADAYLTRRAAYTSRFGARPPSASAM